MCLTQASSGLAPQTCASSPPAMPSLPQVQAQRRSTRLRHVQPTKSCRGVLTPWPAAFRTSSMISCLYFAGTTFALTAPRMTPRQRWPSAVHRSSLRLLCHNVENVNARSARHLHIASNVSRKILDFLEAKCAHASCTASRANACRRLKRRS